MNIRMLDLPGDEKKGDNAVDYIADSPEDEHSLPDTTQRGALLSAEGCQQAIDDAYATFVRNAVIDTPAAVSDNDNGKHECCAKSKQVQVQ
jgi:hypothetical protein